MVLKRPIALKRRTFIHGGLAMAIARTSRAEEPSRAVEAASEALQSATAAGEVTAATLLVRQGQRTETRAFGEAESADAIFLIASISKPISVAAILSLVEQGEIRLDDPLQKHLPEFRGEGREQVSIAQLLTHRSGLPDQLPENESLRRQHQPLKAFVNGAIHTPLLFSPGSRYQYSSMGILLASETAQRVSGKPFSALVQETVFDPLQMRRSALGLGRWSIDQTMRCQVENAAPESGAGSADSKDWDWNSPYWRNLGSPWGGAHASASDIGRFLAAFFDPPADWLRPETIQKMITNQNSAGVTPRGFGFGIGSAIASPACSPQTFGHGGATGTLAWADPATDTICVVLTTLPGRAAKPHPRQQASDRVAEAVD